MRSLGVSEAYITHFWGFLSHAILNVPVEDPLVGYSFFAVGLLMLGLLLCGARPFRLLAFVGMSSMTCCCMSLCFCALARCEEVSATALVRFFRRLVGRSSMEMGFAGCGLGELLTPAKGLLHELGSQVRTSCEVKGFLGLGLLGSAWH